MKLVLKDFQEEAVESLYDRVSDARRRTAQGRLEVVTLAAPTGSGKTVILTRLIELIMQGTKPVISTLMQRFCGLQISRN